MAGGNNYSKVPVKTAASATQYLVTVIKTFFEKVPT